MILKLQFYFQSPNYKLVWSCIISPLLMGFFPPVDIHSIQFWHWSVFFVAVWLISFWLFLQMTFWTLSEHMSIVLHKVIMSLVLIIIKKLLNWSLKILPLNELKTFNILLTLSEMLCHHIYIVIEREREREITNETISPQTHKNLQQSF